MSADPTILLRRVDDGVVTTAVWPLSAILSALSAAGWVVVPREPTEAMVQAATRGVWGDCWNELDDDAQAEAMADCAAHFRAMIAAVLPAAPEARDDGR